VPAFQQHHGSVIVSLPLALHGVRGFGDQRGHEWPSRRRCSVDAGPRGQLAMHRSVGYGYSHRFRQLH